MLPSVSVEWLCVRYKLRIQVCLVWIYVGLHLLSMDLCRSTPAARGLYTKADIISMGYSLGYQHLIAGYGLTCGHTGCRPTKQPHFGSRGKRGGTRKRRKICVISKQRRNRHDVPRLHSDGVWGERASSRGRNLVAVPVSPAASPRTDVGPPLGLTAFPSSIYAINVCSLAKANAKAQLQADLVSYNIDIAIISESHLKKHHKDEICAIEGYQLFRRDRIGRIRGGVAIYARDHLRATICSISNDQRDLELLWVRISTEGGTVLVGALYHPPKPIYAVDDLMDFIERSLDELLTAKGEVAVVLGGDFNQLNVLKLSSRTGLTPLVNVPTRNNKILDMLMALPGASYHIKVITSTVRTDHRAVLATTGEQVKDRAKKSEKRLYRRRTPGHHAKLLQHLRNFDDSLLVSIPDPQLAWDGFYHLTLKWLNDYYPLRSVTVTSREPAFMTPDIKYLLRRKNRLMEQGRLEEASAMAAKIGRSIARSNSRHLRDLDTSHGTKNLWRSVNNLTKVKSATQPSSQVTAEELNAQHLLTLGTFLPV